MTTIVINENTEDGRSLMNVIRAMRKGSKAIVNIYDEEVDATERIPGLPYTYEELLQAIREAAADFAAGRYLTSAEMRKRQPRV
jgi:hypothetical protein